jgi:tetratricopeptide (TPR) repeat protein
LGEANALGSLGDLYLRTERLLEAEETFEMALPIYRALGERLGEARALQALGDVRIKTGKLKEAEDAYTKALPIYRILDEALGEASTLESMGKLALAEALARANALRRRTKRR